MGSINKTKRAPIVQRIENKNIKSLAKIIVEHCDLFATMKKHKLQIPKAKIASIKQKINQLEKYNKIPQFHMKVIKSSFDKGSYSAVIGGLHWHIQGINPYRASSEKLKKNEHNHKMMKEHLSKDFPILNNSKDAYQEILGWLKKDSSKVLMIGGKRRDPSSAGFFSKDFLQKLKKIGCIIAIEIDHDYVSPKTGKTTEEEFIKFNQGTKRENVPFLLFKMSRRYPIVYKLYDAHKCGIPIYPVDSGTKVIKSKLKVTRDEIMANKISKLLKDNPGKKIIFLGGAAHCLGRGTSSVASVEVSNGKSIVYQEPKMLASRLEEKLGDKAVLNVLVADEQVPLKGEKIDFKGFAHDFPDDLRRASVALNPEDPIVRKWLASLPKAKSKFLKGKDFLRNVKGKQAWYVPVYREATEGKPVVLFDMLLIPR